MRALPELAHKLGSTIVNGIKHAWSGTKSRLLTAVSGLIRQYQTAPLILRVILLTSFIWGPGLLGPILVRRYYPAELVDPFGIVDLIVVMLHIPLATIPSLTVCLWFPGATIAFSQRLEEIAKAQDFKPAQVARKWHLPASIFIVSIGMFPFVYGVATDAITEWFEVTSGWGWGFLLFLVGIQAIVVVVTLFRMLAFFQWFTKTVRKGLKMRPIDPDGCGGVGFIGSMISRLTIFAVAMSVWLLYSLVASFYRNNRGQDFADITPGLFLNALILLVTVQILAFLFLIIPTLITRRVMVQERENLLNNLQEAKESASADRYSILTQGLLIMRNYPTLPFTPMQWRILSGITALPTYIGVISSVLQIVGAFRRT